MEPAIEAVNLVKVYPNGVQALRGVTFQARKGEIFSLLGPNGAGKTTTVRILSTLYKPTSGEARILGHDVVRESRVVRGLIGVVSQENTSDDEMTGFDNVYIQARLYGLGRREAQEAAMQALRSMGLEEAAHRRVSTYSGGMRRRLEIAMSLVHTPQVLFLDEPTLGLDVESRRELWDIVLGLKKQGVTILLTTHYMEEAERLSDRVAIINEGRIVAVGTPDELISMAGGDAIHIVPRDPGKAEAILRTLSSAGYKAEVLGGAVVVPVGDARREIVEIARLLDSGEVLEISIVRPNLEEVFLRLTGRRLSGPGEEAMVMSWTRR